MKRLILITFFTTISIAAFSQKKRILLFEEYTPGTVLLLNKTKIKVPLNYDTANKAMMFTQGKDEMILTNNEQVDTIYIGPHKFVYAKQSFLECVPLKNGIVYINWLLKNVSRGYKGIYGQTTQTKVDNINTSYWQRGEYKDQYTEVIALVNENEYQFLLNGKMVSCKNKKSILNLFKDKKEAISTYINEQKLDCNKASDMLTLIDYCLSL